MLGVARPVQWIKQPRVPDWMILVARLNQLHKTPDGYPRIDTRGTVDPKIDPQTFQILSFLNPHFPESQYFKLIVSSRPEVQDFDS
jgi:hypothetical protein